MPSQTEAEHAFALLLYWFNSSPPPPPILQILNDLAAVKNCSMWAGSGTRSKVVALFKLEVLYCMLWLSVGIVALVRHLPLKQFWVT